MVKTVQAQNFEWSNEKIRTAFTEWRKTCPDPITDRLNLSWSNWNFGAEQLSDSAKRLQQAGIRFIELKGNHHGPDLGYRVKETLNILSENNLKVSGVCGNFSIDCDLSSNNPFHRQTALDYIKREIEFAAAVGGSYMLVVAGAPGRTKAYDAMEFERSVETLSMVADLFVQYDIRAAIEPIRSDEISFLHTVADVQSYLRSINHSGVQYINGDVYHMQSEEQHIGEALLSAGQQLINLHLSDSNRRAIGEGSMDIDTIIMALYLLGYNCPGKYVTLEPLLSNVNLYQANYGKLEKSALDRLVLQSSSYFREREENLLR
jgi:sugar phosphate isomerase/epimerase